MWSWLTRVFRTTSAAERAEAEGRIDDAARLYMESGDRAEAVRVLLRAAETARTLEERRNYHVRAYGMARTDDLREQARRGIALVTLAEAEALAPRTDEERRRLTEAAEDLERLGAFKEAGRAWAILEDRDAVVRVLTLAGDVEKLEQVTGARDEAERNALRRRAALEGFDGQWRSGDRTRALRDLRAWVTAHGDDHEARQALDAKAALVLHEGRCELEQDGQRVTVVARFPVVLGREGDVILRGASVSRRHTSVHHDAVTGGFAVEDLASRAGTTLDGVPIGARIALTVGQTVGLGSDMSLRARAGDDPGSLVLEVDRGMDRGRRVLLVPGSCALACGVMTFGDEGPVITPRGAVVLNGQRVAVSFTVVKGDRVESPGHSLTVS